MYKKHTSDESLQKFFNDKGCCKTKCIKTLNLNASKLKDIRTRFWLKSKVHRTEFMYDKLHDSQNSFEGQVKLPLEGLFICVQSFLQIFKIDKGYFYTHLKNYRKGHKSAAVLPRKHGDVYEKALGWLEDYASCYGDRMPDTIDIKLPYKSLKINVWKQYRDEQLDKFSTNGPVDSQFLARSTFMKMWKDHFPHLKIKEVTYHCHYHCY